MSRLNAPLLLLLLAAFAGCKREVKSPTPSVSALAPAAVCGEQLTTSVVLSGAQLAPIVADGLQDAPVLHLPAITLTLATTLAGEAGSGATLKMPDDPANPAASLVRWTSTESMSFDVTPGLQVAPGLYDVRVENHNGAKADLPGALLVVPRPLVTLVEPELRCSDADTSVRIDGDFFIQSASARPQVSLGSVVLAPASLEDCRALPGSAGLQACRRMTVALPADTLAPGTHSVVVTNPPTVACSSSDPVLLTMVPEPTLTKIEPDLICVAQGGTQVTATGTGFIEVDGQTPRLHVGSASYETVLSGCTDVAGPTRMAVKSCSTATAVIGQATLPEGLWAATIVNPEPAACPSPGSVNLVVLPPPEVAGAQPDLRCFADGSQVVAIDGTGFLFHADGKPTVRIGREGLGWVTATGLTASGCSPVDGTLLPGAMTCTHLDASFPQDSLSGDAELVVTNPPPTGCSSGAAPFFLAPKPTLLAATPPGMCTTATEPLDVELVGTGFLAVGGAIPAVRIGNKSYTPVLALADPAECAAHEGYAEAIGECTRLSVQVAPGDLTEGSHTVALDNPAPADCTTGSSLGFSVSPPPAVTGVTPGRICAQGGTVDLVGTGLTDGMQVTIQVPGAPVSATASLTTAGDPTRARVTFTGPIAAGDHPLEVTTGGGGCSATFATPLNVTEGPVVFFVDPAKIFNGITTQATVYASGFAPEGLKVFIRLNTPTGDAPLTEVTASYNPSKANRINFTVAQGTPAGSYDVVIRDDYTTSCPGELLNAFEVVDQTTLQLTAIDPPFGTTQTETAVLLTADPSAVGGGLQNLPRLYLNPSTPGAVAVPLESVAFIDSSRVTAIVPRNQAAGSYTVIAVNPNGAVGVGQTFKLVPDLVPAVDAVTPASLVSGQVSAITVRGANFNAAATVAYRCRNAADLTAPIVLQPTGISVAAGGASLTATLDATGAPEGVPCLVRVTNPDGTYGDFSSTTFTNPAQKLSARKSGAALNTARRALVAMAGKVTRTAQFLYAVGGDQGTAATALNTVESAPLDIYGEPGTYSVQRNRLVEARAFATGQRIGRFLYVAGGRNAAGAVLDSVERAYLLNPADRVDVTDLDLQLVSAGLAPGTYQYRVAAVMGAGDAFNPGGENLPSDPFPVVIPTLAEGKKLTVRLSWTASAGAGAYRVYRAKDGGPDRLIATLDGAAVSFLDDGSAAQVDERPLPIGSTGVWKVVATLPGGAREGAASASVRDLDDPSAAYLYVLGGRRPGTPDVHLDDTVTLPIAEGADFAQTVGTPTLESGNPFGPGRWLHGAVVADAVNAPRVGAKRYLYVVAGQTAGGNERSVYAAEVGADGALATWADLGTMSFGRAGFGHALANNFIYAFGGKQGAPDNSITSAAIDTAAPNLVNWTNSTLILGSMRFLMGSTLHGPYIFVLGGTSDLGTESSTEQFIY